MRVTSHTTEKITRVITKIVAVSIVRVCSVQNEHIRLMVNEVNVFTVLIILLASRKLIVVSDSVPAIIVMADKAVIVQIIIARMLDLIMKKVIIARVIIIIEILVLITEMVAITVKAAMDTVITAVIVSSREVMAITNLHLVVLVRHVAVRRIMIRMQSIALRNRLNIKKSMLIPMHLYA